MRMSIKNQKEMLRGPIKEKDKVNDRVGNTPFPLFFIMGVFIFYHLLLLTHKLFLA